jgi:hypothetical protein
MSAFNKGTLCPHPDYARCDKMHASSSVIENTPRPLSLALSYVRSSEAENQPGNFPTRISVRAELFLK